MFESKLEFYLYQFIIKNNFIEIFLFMLNYKHLNSKYIGGDSPFCWYSI